MSSNLLFFFIFFFVIVCARTVCNAATIPKYTAMIVIGDSTVDPGNNNFIPTLFRSNFIPYGQDFPNHIPSGRFTNGKLVTDILAALFGIKELVPAYLNPRLSNDDLRTGVSFASAGSGLDDLTEAEGGVIPVSKQTQIYFKAYKERLITVVGDKEANRIVSGALVVISAGTNDLVFNFYRKESSIISQYQDFLLEKLRDRIQDLYNLGGRTFGIPGLGPVGCIPLVMTLKLKARVCLEDVNADASLFNTKLQKLLHKLQATLPGTIFTYVDLYGLISDMIKNPQKYGFTVTNRGCCGSGLLELGPLCNALTPTCSNTSQFLFWDAVHPSEAVYKVAAKLAFDTLQNAKP
ncbi:hypothetical protein GIB67_020436 [Kingdonia uniflora]|uniref:GDSL esterase/lipase n=1 Tax=Kingdonia uniflora TaxID=39325 RepID=A0A7J7LUX9_9MAGN|nr:hypothetical protein GIB67_020436 [Kingdonia uniflora]